MATKAGREPARLFLLKHEGIKVILKKRAEEFWLYVAERQIIWYKKEAMATLPPWTCNEILQRYHFCNNYRELDSGTKLLKSVLDRCRTRGEILLTSLAYRFFNRPEWLTTMHPHPLHPKLWNTADEINKIDAWRASGGTIFSRAYRIRQFPVFGTKRKEKHVQACMAIERAVEHIKDRVADMLHAEDPAGVYNALVGHIPMVGEFLAMQVILDLTYVGFFEQGWATADNLCVVGPGAKAALDYLSSGKVGAWVAPRYITSLAAVQEEALEKALEKALNAKGWRLKDVTPYDLGPMDRSNIEFALCEFHKYTRLREGAKHGIRRYHGGE